jgi:hypothetical protein
VDADPFGAGDLACGKCCGMCTLTHAVVSPSVPHIMFRMWAMEFAASSDLVFGALPWIDPGIPKRIA